MNRKDFLKKSVTGFGLVSLAPMIIGCSKDDPMDNETIVGNDSDCLISPAETEGPFPTKDPESLNMEDITSDRTGVPMSILITIADGSNECTPIKDVIVDIWHCDKDGYYSEYGGSGLQQVNLQDAHFLRGRQTTNANGQVSFQSIFPGWYRGRAPHIHVHVYDSNGRSLLVTQIAFPEETCNTVYTTATDFYTNGTQDTSNESDNVFRDGYDAQLSSIEGNISEGYALAHQIAL